MRVGEIYVNENNTYIQLKTLKLQSGMIMCGIYNGLLLFNKLNN